MGQSIIWPGEPSISRKAESLGKTIGSLYMITQSLLNVVFSV